MFLVLRIATLLATFARPTLAHGYVSGIVANGIYTEGWQVAFWYDIVNGVTIPQTPGWYEEELDLGFIPPSEYQYALLRLKHIFLEAM
jgi:cellulase